MGKATEEEWLNQIKGQYGSFLAESAQFLILLWLFSNVIMKEVLKKLDQMCTGFLNTIVQSQEQEKKKNSKWGGIFFFPMLQM